MPRLVVRRAARRPTCSTMKAKIHRGASEVGGSCVELEAEGQSILVDVGLPLECSDPSAEKLPEVSPTSRLLGAIISHSHPDHSGLAYKLGEEVPIFTGRDTDEILKVSARYSHFTPPDVTGHLQDSVPFDIGPFKVTPHLVDHSAYDAYSFVIDAEGRRLFYSGDFRGHGRKSGVFDRMVRCPPTDVDVLLLEGTSVGREASGEPDEQAVESRSAELFKATKGLVLAMYSPQNVDRLVSVYRAAKRSGRTLVMDLYAAELVKALDRDSIPQPGWDGVRVYVPNFQRQGVIKTGEFERIDAVHSSRIFREELLAEPSQFAMTFRSSMARELVDVLNAPDTASLWMMWPGYLDDGRGDVQDLFREHGIPMMIAHSSGHARVEDLQRLARAMEAERVVPIHTDCPELFGGLFDRVERHPDGEWWAV